VDVPRAPPGSVGGIAKRKTTPSARTEADAQALRDLLGIIPEADGMYVRCDGKALIVGRREATGPRGALEDDDRLRLTSLGAGAYVIWVRVGDEYEFTELGGGIADLQAHLEGPLLHLLHPLTPKRNRRRGTSGT
jgi:hypothetical protein